MIVVVIVAVVVVVFAVVWLCRYLIGCLLLCLCVCVDGGEAAQDGRGFSALHVAAAKGSKACISLLLEVRDTTTPAPRVPLSLPPSFSFCFEALFLSFFVILFSSKCVVVISEDVWECRRARMLRSRTRKG